MKNNIWIFNHYAGPPSITNGSRHYNFAKNLINNGYNVTVFAASTIHNSSKNLINDNTSYILNKIEGVPFVFLNCRNYTGNKFKRILNMFDYYRGLYKVTKCFDKPDVIIGSSVHPLACLAAMKLSKKYNCQYICEIRDLWPESFLAYNIIRKNNPLLKLLYLGEKWLYKKADKVIFTMEGGKDYIVERGWDNQHGGPINIGKVYHINNGVDTEMFDYNKDCCKIDDLDLKDTDVFKVVYTGSIRRVNQVGLLLDVAGILKEKGIVDIKFLIWGNGDQLDVLKKRVADEKLDSIHFKGNVDKKYIPYITSQSQLNIVIGKKNPLFRFGASLNKMFDYFAAGKPVLFTYPIAYSLVERYNAGIELDDSSALKIADSILFIKNIDTELYERYCLNARRAAEDYDFKKLTMKLIEIIEK